MNKEVTGTMFYYYHVCKRKLWLSYHHFNYEIMNDNVVIGKKMHELDEKEEYLIGSIKIDEIDKEYVIEKKKSDAEKKSSEEQLYYYLYKLKELGIDRKGKLIFFETNSKSKKEHIITLKEEKIKEIKKKEEHIKEIVNNDKIPKVEQKNICKKCAYYDFCFA